MEEDPVMMELLKKNTEIFGLNDKVKALELQVGELQKQLAYEQERNASNVAAADVQISEINAKCEFLSRMKENWGKEAFQLAAKTDEQKTQLQESNRLNGELLGAAGLVLEELVNLNPYDRRDVRFPSKAETALRKAVENCTEKRVDPQQNCDHEWSHIEDHHVYCPKCKKTADLCWTCESEKHDVGGILTCLKCRGN